MAKSALIIDVTGQGGVYLARPLMTTLAMVKARIGGALPLGLTL
jgi:hypothetical protein